MNKDIFDMIHDTYGYPEQNEVQKHVERYVKDFSEKHYQEYGELPSYVAVSAEEYEEAQNFVDKLKVRNIVSTHPNFSHHILGVQTARGFVEIRVEEEEQND